MNEKQLAREIQAIEKQMLDLAHILEFGKTAKARDRLSVLKKRAFSIELRSE